MRYMQYLAGNTKPWVIMLLSIKCYDTKLCGCLVFLTLSYLEQIIWNPWNLVLVFVLVSLGYIFLIVYLRLLSCLETIFYRLFYVHKFVAEIIEKVFNIPLFYFACLLGSGNVPVNCKFTLGIPFSIIDIFRIIALIIIHFWM